MNLQKYLNIDPKIQHGKVCFRGTRIPIYVVLELLGGGVSVQEITGEDYYPDLTPHHVKAALNFAAQFARNQEFLHFQKSH